MKHYGIYLGSEYASIACSENLRVTSLKIDVTDDVMPCCVHFNRRNEVIVGKRAVVHDKNAKRNNAHKQNTFSDFTRTIGTDKSYVSPNMDGLQYSSEELSAEVLKALKSFITDEDFKSVVITVPAKFTVNQKTATIEAAKLAGFNHVELLQEPIAAAMAYGLTSAQKDGYWLVFDFGGGTFDAALIKVEDGIIQVFDTEGDNYLGGKNLDYAIVDNILLPYLQENYSIEGYLSNPTQKDILREAMKTYTEEIKNELSFKDSYSIYVDPGDLGEDEDGEEFEIDLTVTKDEVYNAIRPLFQKAVDICKELLKRNNLTKDQLGKLILVGGPTHSPLVRQMLKEQVSPKVDTSINPMTAFAEGAALWAEKLYQNNLKSQSIALEIPYDSFVSETSIWVPVTLTSDVDPVTVQFIRFDGWESESITVDKCGNVVELYLVPNSTNQFSIQCMLSNGEFVSNVPGYIEIIHGIVDDFCNLLPYTIATETISQDDKVTKSIIGLKRGTKLPAIGVYNGIIIDSLDFKIPIYQCDEKCELRNVALSDYIGDFIFPNNILNDLLGETLDISINVDRDENLFAYAYLPSKNIEIPLDLKLKTNSTIEDESFVIEEMSKALRMVRGMAKKGYPVSKLDESLKPIITSFLYNEDVVRIKKELRNVLKEIY